MPEMKGITVKIPADLHAEVKAYLEAHGMTMGEFIAQAVDHELHPKIQITQEDKNMERMRTLAFQVPDSLFQRVKAYLERNHMTQKQFVIGLIESEIEQDEAQYQASHPAEQEDKEESDDQTHGEETEEENQDEFAPQEAQEGPSSELEEQLAAQEDAAPVDDFEAGSEEVSQEDDGVEETGEEEAWEESAGQENSQDEEEQEDYTTRLFIHCLLKANWQEKAWKGETIRRGQFVTSLSKLAEETGLTIRQTRTALSHLEKTGELTSQTNAKRRIITVNNYEKFQGSTKQSPSNRQTTDKPEGNRATTTKEYIKNIKEEKESANAQFAPPGQEEKVYLDDYYRERDGG